ncbi:hypothetical protein BD779DRAFT_1486175 [Infundibulicybe gibba]|nr:hypothetical protein BD779DRAFT_1486175 [Infundibulicybe gibba]
MSLAPSPSATRGEIVLQPSYFTSSVFVNRLREDITILIQIYQDQYSQSQPTQPFTLFKNIWCSQGWKWLHFKVFDDRTRETFLNITLRLFLERIFQPEEPPFNQAVAVFGFYTFFYTQPDTVAPPLYTVKQLPIPIDQHTALFLFPGNLITPRLQPLQPVVSHILSVLLKDAVFFILPRSSLGAHDPRALPRELFMEQDMAGPETSLKKKGRPTKRDKANKARTALEGLDTWTENASSRSFVGLAETTKMNYQAQKSDLLATLGSSPAGYSAVSRASEHILDRLKVAEENTGVASTGDLVGLERASRAVRLLEGAGATQTSTD